MAVELSEVLENNHIPRKTIIHDVVDGAVSLTLTSAIGFPCDPVDRDYRVDNNILWDNVNSNFKDSIVNGIVAYKFKVTANGTKGTVLTLKMSVPNPTLGTIPILEQTETVNFNNVDTDVIFAGFVYNGSDSEAHLYGFDVTIESDTSISITDTSVVIICP